MHNDKGDKWAVINLPAIAEQNDLLDRKVGEPLWPERYDLDELKGKKPIVAHICGVPCTNSDHNPRKAVY